MTKGADGQTDRTAKVGREIVATGGVINGLHTAVAAWFGFLIDGIDGTLADTLMTDGAEVAHPEMLVFLALCGQRGQVGDVGVDGVDAQPGAFAGGNQQPVIANRAQSGQLGQVNIVGDAAQRGAGIGGIAVAAQVNRQFVGDGR